MLVGIKREPRIVRGSDRAGGGFGKIASVVGRLRHNPLRDHACTRLASRNVMMAGDQRAVIMHFDTIVPTNLYKIAHFSQSNAQTIAASSDASELNACMTYSR
jgi:hypothetical protein